MAFMLQIRCAKAEFVTIEKGFHMLLEMTRATQAGLRQEKQYEVISNHLANASTTGFKKDVLSFDQVMKATLTTDFSIGDPQITGGKLDVALGSKGFFKVETPQGVRYTRNGNFFLNTDRQIVNAKGYPVLGENGPITLEGKDVFINEIGQVFSDGALADRLSVVDFPAYNQLVKEGDNNFRYEGNAGDETAPQGLRIIHGALESSNMNVIYEMTKMIESHRMYESINKMMRTIDELDGEANTMATAD